MGLLGATEIDDVAVLPLYVTEPSPTRAATVPVVLRRAVSAVASFSPASTGFTGIARTVGITSACFARFLEVPGGELPAVVAAWWSRATSGPTATVGDRLQVFAPRADRGEWILPGRLRRPGARSLPVLIELWAHDRWCTRMTMVPQARVATSQRYFSMGNDALDRLSLGLIGCHRGLAGQPEPVTAGPTGQGRGSGPAPPA